MLLWKRAGAGADATARDGDAKMRLARACSANQHDIAPVGEERPGGEIADGRFVDRGAGEREVGDLLGERHLVFDRAGMLVGDLGLQQIADDVPNGILTR